MVEGVVSFEFELTEDGDTDWRVSRIDLNEEISNFYTCGLDLARFDNDETITAESLKDLIGASCCLTIERQDGSERKVAGIVGSLTDHGCSADNYHWIRIGVFPAFWALSKRKDARFFQDKTVPEILEEVIGDGIAAFQREPPDTSRLSRSDYPKRDYCTQYNESDFRFAMRLMQEEGISFYFDHSAGVEKMVLVDDNMDYDPGPTLDRTADEHMLLDFHASNQLHASKTFTFDINWKGPGIDIEEIFGEDNDWGLTIYESIVNTAFAEGDSAALQAQIRQELEEAAAKPCTGSSRVVDLCAGYISPVLTDDVDGEYLITNVRATGFSTERFGVAHDEERLKEDEFRNTFTCLHKDTPYRPSRHFPRPSIPGFLQAKVVGEEEIETDSEGGDEDGHGRVKVEFDWDPEKKATCWIRVAQSWAGQGFGSWFLPRKGMEVAVVFKNGDPDQPLIIGCMYNGDNPNFVREPADKSQSGFRTCSVTDKAEKGHNELIFEDAKDKEEIYVHAEKDHNLVVKNNETVIIGDQWDQENWPSRAKKKVYKSNCEVGNSRIVLVGEGARDLLPEDESKIVEHNEKLGLKNPKHHCGLRGALDTEKDKPKFTAKLDKPGWEAKGPKNKYKRGNSEWKIVAGNQRNEVRGNRSHIVGHKQDAPNSVLAVAVDSIQAEMEKVFGKAQWACESGNEMVEVFGGRKVEVHGETDFRWLGAQKNIVGGACFDLFYGVKAAVEVAAKAGLNIGTGVETKLGAWLTLGYAHEFSINFAERLKQVLGKEFKRNAEDTAQAVDKRYGLFAKEKAYIRGADEAWLIGGGEAPELKSNETTDTVTGEVEAETTGKKAIKAAVDAVKWIKTATKEHAKWLKESTEATSKDVDKTFEAIEKEHEKAGHVKVTGDKAIIGVDDTTIEIEKGKVVIKVGGSEQLKITDSKVEVTPESEFKDKVKVKGKFEGKDELKNPSLKSQS